jgi:RNA polymerase sigma-70 factor (ECF subfamily)
MAISVGPPRATERSEAENLAAHLYATYSDRILRYCAGQLRNRSEAEDAVQSTFLYAFRSLQDGVVPRYELAWLLKIAENVCRTQRRNAQYRNRFEDQGETRVEELVAAPEPQRVDLLKVTRALGGLPESQRSALLLREWRGLSYREIAAELETTVTATEMLLFRARRSLATLMRDEPLKRARGRIASAINLGQLVPALKSLVVGAVAANTAVGVAAVALIPSVRHAAPQARAVRAAPPASATAQAGIGSKAVRPRRSAATTKRLASFVPSSVHAAPSLESTQASTASASVAPSPPETTLTAPAAGEAALPAADSSAAPPRAPAPETPLIQEENVAASVVPVPAIVPPGLATPAAVGLPEIQLPALTTSSLP